jgi:endonuclease/exonuclease/phosphatase family metal-dependent hydrolase
MSRVFIIAVLLSGCAISPQFVESGRVQSCRTVRPETAEPARWLLAQPYASELDAWCAGVGPALAGRAAARGPRAVDSLLVVSWNVHVGGGDLAQFVGQLRTGELTGGAPVADYVLLLQEVHRESEHVPHARRGMRVADRIETHPAAGERVSIDVLAERLGLNVIYIPSMNNGHGRVRDMNEDRGNAILSTLALVDAVALELPIVRQRRVAVVGTTRGRTSTGHDWELQLTSAHFENRGGRDIVGLHGRGRQAEWLMTALPAAEFAVLGGDLNTWVQGPAEPAVSAVLPHFPETPSTLPDGPTHTSHGVVRARLDYLFARVPGGSMRDYTRVPDQYGSDHHPVMAWIHFPESATGRSQQ